MKLRRPRYKTRLQWEMLEWQLQEAKLHNQKLVESNEVLKDDVRELQEKLAEANMNIRVSSAAISELQERVAYYRAVKLPHAPLDPADAEPVAVAGCEHNPPCLNVSWCYSARESAQP